MSESRPDPTNPFDVPRFYTSGKRTLTGSIDFTRRAADMSPEDIAKQVEALRALPELIQQTQEQLWKMQGLLRGVTRD